MSAPLGATPRWPDPSRWNHFVEHGRQVGAQTVEQYEASALATIAAGTPFHYNDRGGQPRLGYYERASGRFVALNARGTTILSHFLAHEGYVRNLPNSTYA